MKAIQSSSAPIKPHEALTYHQLWLCTLLYARWNQTIEFCNTPIFVIPDPVPTETILDINWCFAWIMLKVYRSNNGTAGSTFVQGLTHLIFARGYPTELFFFGKLDQVSTVLAGVWVDFFVSSLIFYFVRVFSPNTISNIIIVEYSTILVLEYFEEPWPMWDFLKPDWNVIRIVWLGSKINTLDVSWIKLNRNNNWV